jgi:hypothetical protein
MKIVIVILFSYLTSLNAKEASIQIGETPFSVLVKLYPDIHWSVDTVYKVGCVIDANNRSIEFRFYNDSDNHYPVLISERVYLNVDTKRNCVNANYRANIKEGAFVKNALEDNLYSKGFKSYDLGNNEVKFFKKEIISSKAVPKIYRQLIEEGSWTYFRTKSYIFNKLENYIEFKVAYYSEWNSD